MAGTGSNPSEIKLLTLTDLGQGSGWRLSLPHARDRMMVAWLVRGEGRVMAAGRKSGFAPGSACVWPAGSLTSLNVSPRAFGAAMLIPDAALPDLGDLWPGLVHVAEPALRQSLNDLAQRALGGLDAHLDASLIDLISRAGPPPQAPSLPARFFQRVVMDRPASYSMAAHAAALGVSPTHLTRVCRAELGISAADVMTDHVLHVSRTALEDTPTPVKDIAQAIGFSSAAYFTRFIQKHTNQTPTALRKSSRAAA